MNKHKLLLIVILLFVGMSISDLKAQVIKGEVFAGASVAQVDGDDCYGYKRFRGQIGAGALVPITNWMDVALEVQYNPKGAYKKDSIVYSSYYTGTYDLRLNYVEIPVMVYLTDKSRYTVGLGASFGRLVGFSEKINGMETDTRIGDGKLRWIEGYDEPDDIDLGKIKTIEDLDNPAFYDTTGMLLIQNSNSYKKNDFSICADLRIRIWESLHVQLRYQYSMVPIRTRLLYANSSETIPNKIRLQYNNQISLRFTYILGEDRAKINRDIQKEQREANRRY
ncbi:MAG: outer membrane beta-barrel protein [Bacteroidales bacterium]|nr:outer membrane beta-barrel protein [Bacteroidales bacterium]